MEKIVLSKMTKEELVEYMISIGEKKFKAMQVFEWLYIHKEYF